MSQLDAPQTPPGWYPDPWYPATSRYWDGASWTTFQNPPAAPVSYAPPLAPEGTGWNTVWIWLIVLIPLISILTLLVTPWDSMFRFDPSMLDQPQSRSMMTTALWSPLYVLTSILSYAVYGATVFFAYLDYRELLRRGVPKPFFWAWAFLNPVYPFGRSIIVKRRTGHGMAPLWVTVGVIVLSYAVSGVVLVMLFSSMFDMLRDVATYVS